MITNAFYRYRAGKSLIDTPNVPPKGTVYETLTQAIADTGKALTDGTKSMRVVITADISKWAEVAAPPKPIRPGQATAELTLVKAELDRYKRAVAEVVSINTATALKTSLVDAVNRLKVAVAAETIKTEPIVKEIQQ